MSRATINFRIDSELKKQMEDICKRLVLNMTSALTVYVTKVVNEQRIPFEI
ncbi:MAG: type II toxin-antitoxin system RelB/DinJ family antitoxin [Peptoniphilus harei]|nr:type II toxin-antitoxin system RelB/DinJ family antitoxin [Peptoniphilus harei]